MADRDVRMVLDSWINRCRSFAEGVVVMVSPVLLAFALTKVNLTEEHGRVLPTIMLAVAAVTLFAGIGPFLAFSSSRLIWRAPNQRPRFPHAVTKWLAPLCSACLVALACWIMSLIIHNNKALYSVPAAVIGFCITIRSVQYCYSLRDDADHQQEDQGYYNRLDNSLECLAGITGFLFLGLESLALESFIRGEEEAQVQRRLTAPMATSIWACAVGVFTMLLATIPPSGLSVRKLTAAFDVVVGAAVFLVMFFMMYAVIKRRALIVMAPGFLIFIVYVLYVAVSSCRDGARPNNDGERGGDPGEANGGNHDEEHEPAASLELTKVTFVGFLAVSIPRISDGSVDRCTECFIHLAAAAIVSGLMWRLLTHLKSDGVPKAALNFASVVTHFCIVVAVVPFSIMAGNALHATATAPAPAPVF